MKAGVTPRPTRTPISPPGYPTQRGNAALRFFLTCTLFIRWRVSSVSHSTLLTPIIRRPPPLRVTPCSQICRPSRLRPGNNNLLTLSLSVLTLCAPNTSVFSVPRQSSPKEQRRPGQPECRTCLSRRRRLKIRQLPPRPPFPWIRRLKPLPRPPRQRPKRQLIRRPPAQPHRLTTRTW